MTHANEAQTRNWDGAGGCCWATRAAYYDPGMDGYQPDLVETTGAGPADRVLDVGCGNGITALDLARRLASALAEQEWPLEFMLAGHFAGALDALDPDERPSAREDLRAVIAAHETPDGVPSASAPRLVTARR